MDLLTAPKRAPSRFSPFSRRPAPAAEPAYDVPIRNATPYGRTGEKIVRVGELAESTSPTSPSRVARELAMCP